MSYKAFAKTIPVDAAGEKRDPAATPGAPVELSIIFVNWNSVDYLRDCISGIYQNTRGLSFEIIVVDNASTQEGVETLQDHFPDIILIRSDKNVGFAGANNIGFKRSTGEYVLFLNPDTQLVGSTANTLVDAIKALPDAGVVGCKMLNTDLSVQITSIQKFPTILNQIVNSEHLQLRWPGCPIWNIAPLFRKQSKPLKVDVIPGACMLMRRSAFQRVGMFSEDYFMYAEDIDLNYKLKKAGYTSYYIGEATIVHHGGKSSSLHRVGHWATMMKYRAMMQYYRKTRGRFYAAMYRTAMGCVAVGRLVFLALLYPFANIFWDRQSLRHAFEKWEIVLKWAIERQTFAFRDR